jgi:hypothetical protein
MKRFRPTRLCFFFLNPVKPDDIRFRRDFGVRIFCDNMTPQSDSPLEADREAGSHTARRGSRPVYSVRTLPAAFFCVFSEKVAKQFPLRYNNRFIGNRFDLE